MRTKKNIPSQGGGTWTVTQKVKKIKKGFWGQNKGRKKKEWGRRAKSHKCGLSGTGDRGGGSVPEGTGERSRIRGWGRPRGKRWPEELKKAIVQKCGLKGTAKNDILPGGAGGR